MIISKAGLRVKATAAAILMPGTVVGVVPYCIHLRTGSGDWPGVVGLKILGVSLGVAGLALLIHSIRGFAAYGGGTLAPVEPPRVLVVRGFYRYTRNPMYVGVTFVLFAEALFFSNLWLLFYAAGVFVCFHLFVIMYEEPQLSSRLGESYERYRRKVPRWGVCREAIGPIDGIERKSA